MRKHLTTAILALALACSVTPAPAQDAGRTLYWRRLDVAAHIDADGRLHVRERQAMVFNGAWNGGERSFNIRPGQHLDLTGISRIDAAGTAHALARGDIDQVDHFEWADSKTLRWRSRLPNDPPFANQEIVYEIDYALSNILIPAKDGYRLDHDFAFPDRAGIIASFSLELDADAKWQSTSLPLHLARENVVPGSTVVVTLPLRYIGAGNPRGVERGEPLLTRVLLALFLLGSLALMLRSFLSSETARGRFVPLTLPEHINADWLRENVFSIPPEVVGAAWDATTSSPEVAAMIARMVQEGKLVSRVEKGKRKEILHLELKVARMELSENEQKLVDALFSDGETQTDTEQIKERYKKSGFNPGSLITPGIQKQIKALLPNDGTPADPRGILLYVVAVMIVIGATIASVIGSKHSAMVVVPVVTGILGMCALGFAIAYRVSVVDLPMKAWRFVVLLLIASAPTVAVLLAPLQIGVRPRAPLLAAMIVQLLGFAFLAMRAARTREGPAKQELRRKFAAARAYFARELQLPKPQLEDEWFPYLMAFGLGTNIDKWFRAFPGVSEASRVIATSAGMAASTASSGWSGGGPLFGGGGGFGGGGAGRSWASVAETFSSGVASPSSGSGGGGGGGGGSSGGGGGGGW